jgi:hypothetical protein
MYTQLGIPFARGSHTSHKAAVRVGPKRGAVTQKYLDLLREAGTRGLIDAEAAGLLNRPVSSVCSIRNGCSNAGLIRRAGERMGPWGVAQTIWLHSDIRSQA